MKNNFGVMQGRLLPKYQGRYQAHPVGYWQDEFFQAKKFDLDCIEFILDFNDAEENPLLTKNGHLEILELSSETGVAIKTVCADYFMEAPLHSSNDKTAEKSFKILEKLLEVAKILKITDIVIPCVDQSTLNGKEAVDRFIVQMKKIIPTLDKYCVNLSLETDLAPKPFVELLSTLNSKRITVNYDIGNSAALGFDSIKELEAYGHKISDIHIKDRVLNGGPIVLGEGNADFDRFFNKLKEFDYSGPFIMQAYRDDEGLEVFKKQLAWIKKVMQDSYEG
jgi:L-ribulose-5-phosphate 3-epimerase